MITQVLDTAVFSGAAGIAGATIWSSVSPQWHRIVRLASGRPEQGFTPLTALVCAERRIAVRRWAATSRPGADWREAA